MRRAAFGLRTSIASAFSTAINGTPTSSPAGNSTTDRVSRSTACRDLSIRSAIPSDSRSPARRSVAVDETGDVKTADIFKGLIRHIERQSKADTVRSYASFYAITVGRGFYRIVTRYIDDLSFDQEIYVQQGQESIQRLFRPRMPGAGLQRRAVLLRRHRSDGRPVRVTLPRQALVLR